jgi:Na+/H+ antiporter NhaC
MQNIKLTIVFFLAFFLVTTASSAQLRITAPSFVLSGVKSAYEINGLDESSNRATQYKIVANNQTIESGVSLPKDLKTIKFAIPTCGSNELTLTVADQTATTHVRCIPGWLSILPPVLAIILALITREVISSLFLGTVIGATFVFSYNPFIGFLRTLDKYLLGSVADTAHSAIIIFSLCLGGMIGVVNRTGGMQGIVELISRMITGPRSAQLATWFMGVLIFFDDYANTLIVGNSMRPVTDKNKISREKLSYIVDSTSAPVAGIAVLSTWIGYEIGLIREAFVNLGIPETNFYGVFLQTIPFRFYCLLTLFFGFMIAFFRRDFGPMLKAEQRAHHEGKVLSDTARPISSPESAAPELPADMPKRWYNAAIPIAIVIIGTFVGLLGDGGMYSPHFYLQQAETGALTDSKSLTVTTVSQDNGTLTASGEDFTFARINFDDKTVFAGKSGIEAISLLRQLKEGNVINTVLAPSTMTFAEKARSAFSNADSTRVLIWVSVLGSMVAVFLGWIQGLINLETGLKAWVDGARTLIMAVIIMTLAWSINGVCTELGTAHWVVAMVTDVVPHWMLPTIIFIIACFISFATGTSWGTMAILLPISIPLAYHLNMQHYQASIASLPNATEMMVFIKQSLLLSIGAVLEGSIFGDHCSPISDTTIMSSMASGSDHIDHVKTQAPYAAIVALIAIILCYIPAGLGASPFIMIPISMTVLAGFIFTFGQRPEKSSQNA